MGNIQTNRALEAYIKSYATGIPGPVPGGGVEPLSNTYSLDFDGVDDYLSLNSAVSLGTTSTISFWFKSATTMTGKTIIGEDTYTYDYLCQVSSGIDSVYLRIGTVVKTFTGVTEISNGHWNNWCIVRSGDSVEIFINGVSKGTQTGYGTGTDTQFDTIGAQGNGTGYITGQIDEVSGFSTALGVDDIAKISAAPIDLKTALSVTPEVWYRNGDF